MPGRDPRQRHSRGATYICQGRAPRWAGRDDASRRAASLGSPHDDLRCAASPPLRIVVALGGNAMTGPDGNATSGAQRHAIAPPWSRSRGCWQRGTTWCSPMGTAPRWATSSSRRARRARRAAGPARLVRRPDAGNDRLHDPRHPGCGACDTRPDAAYRGPRQPHARLCRRSGLRPTDEAHRSLPPTRAGADPHRPRRALGGPGRARLASCRRLPGAARGARGPHGAHPARCGLRRRRGRRRRHTGRARRLGAAHRRRGRHRQGPDRGPPRHEGGRRRPRHRDRRRPRIVGWGRPDERALGRVTSDELEGYAANGEFASGSMGPKVEAALRFIRSGGRRCVITSLDEIASAVDGHVGTVIENPDHER